MMSMGIDTSSNLCHYRGDILHATIIDIRSKQRTYKYHDSNGIPRWYNSVLEALSSYIQIFAKEYTYIPPTCPLGIQMLTEMNTVMIGIDAINISEMLDRQGYHYYTNPNEILKLTINDITAISYEI